MVIQRLRRAVRWLIGALNDTLMAVLFICVTVPLTLIGTASAFGTAIGLGLTVFGDERGTRMTLGSLAIFAFSLVILAGQDYLYKNRSNLSEESLL
ncbi:MAG TPA: hypothetical protein PKV96_02240 [Candidatus Saccharimonas sp.]|nr:hypothetical protein [Candidatus Saccharimonas sp.]